MNLRSLALVAFVSSLVTGCNDFDRTNGDVSRGEVMEAPVDDDLDGNGVTDAGNQSYAFGQSDLGATFIAFFGPTLPNGSAAGVAMSMRGYGSEEYSDAEYGWATNFLPLPEAMDSNGNVVGYGIAGLRDGTYEFNCARSDAQVGSQDGWCKPSNTTPSDNLAYLVEITNGDETCPRLDKNWGITVANGIVTPTGESFALPDTNCYDEE